MNVIGKQFDLLSPKYFFIMKNFLTIAFVLLIVACTNTDKKAEEQETKDAPMMQSANSMTFNSSFAGFLVQYYHLKDALVLSDEAMATNAAKVLEGKADSLNLNEIHADSSIIDMANGNLGSIKAEAKAIQALTGIENKRKSFQIISENMYDLIRTVKYDKETVYHQFCPMAFDDAGAYWLSASSDIKNPYFGKKMLTCGEVKDSIGLKAK